MTRFTAATAAGLLVAASGWVAVSAQERAAQDSSGSTVADPSCTFFGPQHDRFVAALQNTGAASHLTEQVVAKLGPAVRSRSTLTALAASSVGMAQVFETTNNATASLPSAPGGSRTYTQQNSGSTGIIDKYVFEKMAQSNVAPAPVTTDYEFLRRTMLDLTGRIPTPEQVVAFVNDPTADKRAKLVDQLLGSSQWLDKWTMWLGDLYENNSTNSLGANRFIQGVTAFNSFVRTSLQQDKPYNQMVREMITATGTDSYSQGDLNLLIGGVMGGGPIQDVFDQQTAVIGEKFLGMAHLNCLLCHSGRKHLDALSLWGYYKTRNDAWGMASFLSHTATIRIPTANATNGFPYSWTLADNVTPGTRFGTVVNRTNYTIDYQLNTQTGNRPARGATNSTQTVHPTYIMNGASPANGANYRQFLATQITSDFQFARATVNYLWEYFFGIGLVSPSNQFDPARLDPDHPPSDCPTVVSPCQLQASHPRLLNELAQHFIDSNYSLKAVMREMVNSRAYQLSARYDGTWNPANERLFARKLVRRLWSEEIHDAIAQSSGILPTYNNAVWGPLSSAMQLPEPLNTPGGSTTNFLNAFLRGNRDDESRSGDPAIAQALALMNDTFVMSRVNSGNAAALDTRALALNNNDAVTLLYLTVLSRPPSADELTLAVGNLQTPPSGSTRTQELRNLLWSLYNKVDFIYNY